MARGLNISFAERFWNKVDIRSPNECWHWKAKKNNKGYGMFCISKSVGFKLAHRIAYEMCFGDIKKECLCHKCDNPICVNPYHLFEGTYKDNVDDMMKKGRNRFGTSGPNVPTPLKSTEHPRARFDKQDILSILADLRKGESAGRLSKKYNVDRKQIFNLKHGRTYKDITYNIGVP